jgi:parallel beta helix pectate lyase-like protein
VRCLPALAVLAFSSAASAATLEVGPGKTYATPCAAIAAASAGDTVQVDASGNYDGNTCSWTTDSLTIVGVNGRPKIAMDGSPPTMDKGIFTIYADNATIDNFELSGAAFDGGTGDGDSNGAGIRHQGTNLTVKNCYIHDNQDGILGAPMTANTGSVTIQNSEFYNNGAGDGYTHNLYLGDYTTVTVEYSWSHHSVVGHLLKSRAYTTYVLYNRLSDEMGGTGSYEIDLPYAGTAYVIGNIIEQSAASQNPAIVTYGEEGTPTGYDTHLYFVNNTVLNDLMSGTFVHNATTTGALLENDIFYGGGTVSDNAADTLTTNYSGASPMFADEATLDVHLLSGSPCINAGTLPGKEGSMSLEPVFEYVQPVSEQARTVVGSAIDIGACELGLPDGGAPGEGGLEAGSEAGGLPDSGRPIDVDSGGTPHGDGGPHGESDGGSGTSPNGSSGGCGCLEAGHPDDPWLLAALCPGLLGLLALRRRRVK